ncbi:MAG: NAD(P)-dependent oxidoreductase [Bryobacteraceae bacterium]|jgi:uncharacterized protein YbjT (DUF2867 family)
MRVFISGGTGYMGRSVIPRLLAAGSEVVALARPGSEWKLPGGCSTLSGNALDETTFADRLGHFDAYVHLVGVAHPGPGKERQFREIDRASLEASVRAATGRVRNFVYVSVAQPAPAMRAYQNVRAACERTIREAGLEANILRPWYVLGPGHRWPYVLIPFYRLFELIPATRDGATRLGLVTLPQMIAALAWAVQNPADGVRIIDVPMIRRISR